MDDKTVYEFTVNETLIKTPHEKLSAEVSRAEQN